MIENCALYFPRAKVNVPEVLEGVAHDGGLFRAPSWFQFETAEAQVRLNVKRDGMAEHLAGFEGYLRSIGAPTEVEARAVALVRTMKSTMGVVLSNPIEIDSEAFAALMALADHFDGFVFVYDSILLPDGSALIGPLTEDEDDAPEPIDVAGLVHEGPTEGIDPALVERREAIYRRLGEAGFSCARWLPFETEPRVLRPASELAARYMALETVFLWASEAGAHLADARLKDYAARSDLLAAMTEGERAIFGLARNAARAQHGGAVGWRLENMWALAWVLGFAHEPEVDCGQIPEGIVNGLFSDFGLGLDADVIALQTARDPRPVDEVAALEELFYCAHNAVRSAQLGNRTVPRGFDPMRDGGTVHERRQALTWSLSPGVAWDDTDLST